MDLHAVYCRPNAWEYLRAMSSNAKIACVMVDPKLKGDKVFGCKWVFIEMPYWLSTTTMWILVYNYWQFNNCWNVFKMSISWVSIICSPTLSAIQVQYSYILSKWMYLSSLQVKRNAAHSLPNPRDQFQSSIKVVGLASWINQGL